MHWKLHSETRSKGGKIGGKIVGKIIGKIFGKKYGAINGKKNAIPVLQFTKDRALIKEWPSMIEVERHLGIARSSICQCCKGKSKSAGGFLWTYKHPR